MAGMPGPPVCGAACVPGAAGVWAASALQVTVKPIRYRGAHLIHRAPIRPIVRHTGSDSELQPLCSPGGVRVERPQRTGQRHRVRGHDHLVVRSLEKKQRTRRLPAEEAAIRAAYRVASVCSARRREASDQA